MSFSVLDGLTDGDTDRISEQKINRGAGVAHEEYRDKRLFSATRDHIISRQVCMCVVHA